MKVYWEALKQQLRLLYNDPLLGFGFRVLHGFWKSLDRIAIGWYLPIKLGFLYLTPWIVYVPMMYALTGKTNPPYMFFFFGVHRLPRVPGGTLPFDIWITSYVFFFIMGLVSFFLLDPEGLKGGHVRQPVWYTWWSGYLMSLLLAITPWHF